MIARGTALGLAIALAAMPAIASTPAAWAAQDAAARRGCARASGLAGVVTTPPVIFSDAAGVDVLRVTGRLKGRWAKGKRVTMLCLFTRRTGAIEVQEAPAGW